MKTAGYCKIFQLILWALLPIITVHAQKTTIDSLNCIKKDDSIIYATPPSETFNRIKFTGHQLLTPGVLIGTGIAMDFTRGIKNTQLRLRKDNLGTFHTAVDNMLLYTPAILPYGLDLLGIHSKTDIVDRTAILIKGEMLLVATGILLKHTVTEWRPDRSNHYSFPSGHAMQIFATATLLSEEYKLRYKWMPFVAYGVASGVGLLRVANNKHYLGDVLVGAGLGILSMKIAYWTHHYNWSRHQRCKIN